MLILLRRPHEVIHIGNDIKVMVTKISGNTVSLGIEAPKDVTILRGEVKERNEKNGTTGEKPARKEGKETPRADSSAKGSFGKVLEKAVTTIQEEVVAVSNQSNQ